MPNKQYLLPVSSTPGSGGGGGGTGTVTSVTFTGDGAIHLTQQPEASQPLHALYHRTEPDSAPLSPG